MSKFRMLLLMASFVPYGCAAGDYRTYSESTAVPPPSSPRPISPGQLPSPVIAPSYQHNAAQPIPTSAYPLATGTSDLNFNPLSGRTVLTADDVVGAVLERSPTLDQMRAVVDTVAARFPQATSLDDPMLAFNTAPGSAWSQNVDYAARVEISQKLLYPGKRSLKGTAIRADTAAATADVDETRLQLAEAARSAHADYSLAEKGFEVAEENRKVLLEFRQNAEARYKTAQGSQQDVLQADVELARQMERMLSLRRGRQVAKARINTLMHFPPDETLPPPADSAATGPLPDVVGLRVQAASTRPDLKAVAARLASEEANLALAIREYNPDFEVSAAYDGFWQREDRPLGWQVGARVNLPVRLARRAGAVAEARAKAAQRRAELARLTDRINFEVQEAFEQVRESEDIVQLYRDKILPAAESNVKVAQAGYVAGGVPFLNLVEAQRGRVGLKDRYNEVVAEAARRRAALERAVGSPTALPPK